MRPIAIVLGVDTPIGLTVVRELGEHGVEVHAIARTSLATGAHSRYVARRYLRQGNGDELVGLLNRIAAETGAKLLLTMGESDILFLHRNAEQLRGIQPLIPDPARMATVLDKAATCAAATAVGIEVPRTWAARDASDIARIAKEATYPVILKWADPHVVAQRLSKASLRVVKLEYAYDAGQLTAALSRYVPVGAFPLVQAFVPGHGIGHMVFMHRGEPVLRFQHRRIHEWPPEGGSSTVCDSVGPDENTALMEKSVALLRSIGWEGPAMVEYRYDPDTGRAVLMEINGRFWGSQPLAYHAGAHFAWFTYSILGLGEVPAAPKYRVGVRCRYMIPETKRLFRILLCRGSIRDRSFRVSRLRTVLDYVADFFRLRTRYYVFQWTDPIPWLVDVLGGLLPFFRRR